MNGTSSSEILIVKAVSHTCALNVAHVVEVLRSLPVEPVAGAPDIVRGLSIIRGAPVPIVDLGAVLGACDGSQKRFVVVRTGPRRVAFSVDEILGIRKFPPDAANHLPPLMSQAAAGALQTIGTLDSELLLVLNSAVIVSPELLASLAREEG